MEPNPVQHASLLTTCRTLIVNTRKLPLRHKREDKTRVTRHIKCLQLYLHGSYLVLTPNYNVTNHSYNILRVYNGYKVYTTSDLNSKPRSNPFLIQLCFYASCKRIPTLTCAFVAVLIRFDSSRLRSRISCNLLPLRLLYPPLADLFKRTTATRRFI